MLDNIFHGGREASGCVHRDQDQGSVASRGLFDAAVHVLGHHRLNLIIDSQFDDLRQSVTGRAICSCGSWAKPLSLRLEL